MLLHLDQSLLWLDTTPMVLTWLFGIHWLHQQHHKLLLYAMKVSLPLSFYFYFGVAGAGRRDGLHPFCFYGLPNSIDLVNKR